jgi:putative hemolysin
MQVLKKLRSKLPAIPFRRPRPRPLLETPKFQPIADGRYEARIAETAPEIASALRLRHAVFNVELGGHDDGEPGGVEFDSYDFKCRHLIVRDTESGETVGTYRLNTIETAKDRSGFYSANEFDLSQLPDDILTSGIEIGRACVAAEHRNTKVLFLLWKALLAYLQHSNKRYFFGCCSIFSTDERVGVVAYNKLISEGHFHDSIRLEPVRNAIDIGITPTEGPTELPALFNMYLRLGAKVCSRPTLDRDFGTIDLFVVFDINDLNDKYRRLFSK